MTTSAFYQEMIPLGEAAAVAFHILAEQPVRLRDARQLDETRAAMARALARFAQLYELHDGQAPVALHGDRMHGPADLSRLYLRRSDLVRALEVLGEDGQKPMVSPRLSTG